jgi:archaellum component FlaC
MYNGRMSKKALFFLVLGILLALPLFSVFTGKRGSSIKSVKTASSVSRGESGVAMPAMMLDNAVSPEFAPQPTQDSKFTVTPDRTIVKQATLSLLVNDTRKFVDQATDSVKQMNGFVTSVNVYENIAETGAINADLTIRVPVEKLEESLKQLKSLAAKVTTENVTAEDKTEQKIDLEAQIKNLQATEQQLLAIMKEAKSVEDTLKVQTQLTQTRDKIERMQASLENLTGAADMSTIHISVSTKESGLPIVEPNQTSIWEEVKMAARDTITVYRNLLIVGLRLLVLGSPIILVITIGWLIARRFMP